MPSPEHLYIYVCGLWYGRMAKGKLVNTLIDICSLADIKVSFEMKPKILDIQTSLDSGILAERAVL